MDINASIVDQQLTGLLETHGNSLAGDETKKRSTAFVALCIASSLDIPFDEAIEHVTEGGGDAGVDGLYLGDVEDGEFLVTIFQGKYKRDLGGEANFPANPVEKAVGTIGTLFDPLKAVEMNDLLRPKIEEIRSMIRDGYIPTVRIILCNNGLKWNDEAQRRIDQTGFPSDQVTWLHFNHNSIVDIQRKTKAVNDSLNFSGEAVVEEFNFRRVLVGKVNVVEIAELFGRHNDLLLQRNIRRYLGLHPNRVNSAIHATLVDQEGRNNFYFFNNGITIICKKFRHNALQGNNFKVNLEALQVINGGQTCKTIQQTLSDPDLFAEYRNTYVLVRIYELADDDQEFVKDITFATNSQNPVDLRDLKSNDALQQVLENGIKGLGYTYRRQRDETSSSGSNVLTPSIVAESALAIWQRMPHQAKFRRKEHFGKLYHTIFDDLNPTQAVLGVLIFRKVENERKRSTMEDPPDFQPYASHYLSMIIADLLLDKVQLEGKAQVDHKSFEKLENSLNENFDELYSDGLNAIDTALIELYGERDVSLQQLSATFRRGDLLEQLN